MFGAAPVNPKNLGDDAINNLIESGSRLNGVYQLKRDDGSLSDELVVDNPTTLVDAVSLGMTKVRDIGEQEFKPRRQDNKVVSPSEQLRDTVVEGVNSDAKTKIAAVLKKGATGKAGEKAVIDEVKQIEKDTQQELKGLGIKVNKGDT